MGLFFLFGVWFDLWRGLHIFGRVIIVFLSKHPHFSPDFWRLWYYDWYWQRLDLSLHFRDVRATHDFCWLFIMNDLCRFRLDMRNGSWI